MRRVLAFGPPALDHERRAVRPARFEARPALPLSAACLVGNAVREHLGRLLDCTLSVDLFEPVAPAPPAWSALFDGAVRYRVVGSLGELQLVFRAYDARRFVAAAFREVERAEHDPLSAIEARVLERTACELAPLCAPLCGEVRSVTAATGPGRCESYFELRVGAPVGAVLGLAIARDPAERPGRGLRPEDLHDVPLTVRAEFARGSVRLEVLAGLEIGAVVPMETKVGSLAALKIADVTVARGECGIRAGRSAFTVRTDPPTEVFD